MSVSIYFQFYDIKSGHDAIISSITINHVIKPNITPLYIQIFFLVMFWENTLFYIWNIKFLIYFTTPENTYNCSSNSFYMDISFLVSDLVISYWGIISMSMTSHPDILSMILLLSLYVWYNNHVPDIISGCVFFWHHIQFYIQVHNKCDITTSVRLYLKYDATSNLYFWVLLLFVKCNFIILLLLQI